MTDEYEALWRKAAVIAQQHEDVLLNEALLALRDHVEAKLAEVRADYDLKLSLAADLTKEDCRTIAEQAAELERLRARLDTFSQAIDEAFEETANAK